MRYFIILILVGSAFGQMIQAIVAGALPEMVFTLPAPSASFNMTYTKTGATLHWIWPDGTTSDSNNPTVNIPAGVIRVQSRDGFSGVTSIVSGNVLSGTLPLLPTGLIELSINYSTFSGTLPALPAGLADLGLDASAFSGTLPALPAGMITMDLYTSTFSGILPTLPAGLTILYLVSSTFSGYPAGAFAAQKSLSASYIQFSNVADVNSALVDAVTSLGISGRVICNPFWIAGTSPAPTGAGLTAKAALASAGWTVTTN
jgi:hypothetical protein